MAKRDMAEIERRVIEKVIETLTRSSRSFWHRDVCRALTNLASDFRLKGISARQPKEWLVDVSWSEAYPESEDFHDHGFPGLVLAAEIEFDPPDKTFWKDMRKLMVLQADLKLFVIRNRSQEVPNRIQAECQKDPGCHVLIAWPGPVIRRWGEEPRRDGVS